MYDMFQDLAAHWCQWNGPIICCSTAVSFFEDWCNVGLFPIIRYFALLQSCLKYQSHGWWEFGSNSFRNLVGKWSGPTALWGFRPCISFKTPALSNLNERIYGNLLPLMAGISTDVSSVKTLLNRSFRIHVVALVLGSLCAIRSFLSGDMPLLSYSFALDECIELLGVFVTCHDVAGVTVVSYFTFILRFLLMLSVPLVITVWARILCSLVWPFLTPWYAFDFFLLIQGWLKRYDVILLGILSLRKPRVKSFSVSHSSFTPVETEYYVVNLVEKSSASSFFSSMSTCFHRKIFRCCCCLFLVVLVLASIKTMSWSLTPGTALHFSIKDGRFVRKTSRMFSPLVENLTIWSELVS